MRCLRCLLGLIVLLSLQPVIAAEVEPDQATNLLRASRYEPTECRFYEPYQIEVECGDLLVPEDRANDNSPMIKLHVGIFRSPNANPKADPIVYLEGGPGASALESIAYGYDALIAPFVYDRDFIIFDQRGTGYSEPNLGCFEFGDQDYSGIDQYMLPTDAVEDSLRRVYECRERLVNEGVNLAHYNSAASAADLNDLRIALGYDEWNVYGISYGTRLALTALRDYPEGIRSVVLDSTYPPQVSLYSEAPSNIGRSLDALFLACEADVYCNTAYPDLRNVFFKLVQQLNANPVTVDISDEWFGDNQSVLLSGDTVVGIMFTAFYSEQVIPSLPKLIYAARNGDYETLAEIQFAIYGGQVSSLGMYYSVQCHEEAPFDDADHMLASGEEFPEAQSFLNSTYHLGKVVLSVCQQWGAGAIDPKENLAVVSDIPVLVLAGEFDPITPPKWGQLTTETLPNSYFFEYRGLGHGVSVIECPSLMMNAFLANPAARPDDFCMDQMLPEFIAPGAPIKMVKFSTSSFIGERPASWIEHDEGYFVRSIFDEEASIEVRWMSDYQLEDYKDYPPMVFDFDNPANILVTHEINNLTWNLYSFGKEDEHFDVAIAELGDGSAFVITLYSPTDERDWLYEQVFLSALNAFEEK